MTAPTRAASESGGVRHWFATPGNALLSALVLALATAAAIPVLRWALLRATWSGTAADCRANAGGACWTFIGHKLRFILFGLYPPHEQWRAALAAAVIVAMIIITAAPRFWSRRLLLVWAVALALAIWLMRGGLGLEPVATRQWGGLPVTLILTTLGLALGFPIGVALAFGRRARSPLVRAIASAIVEVVRGVPLIAVLYVAALVVPLALPAGLDLDKLVLAQAAIAIFAGAYLGEAVRAGLQAIPSGQMDAALSIGLRPWNAARLIVLPQALRVVLPSLVSIAVGFFQDTSLVVIIGLFDLLNTARVAAQDTDWLGFHDEAYAFVALLYFTGSFALSRYGQWLERRTRRERP